MGGSLALWAPPPPGGPVKQAYCLMRFRALGTVLCGRAVSHPTAVRRGTSMYVIVNNIKETRCSCNLVPRSTRGYIFVTFSRGPSAHDAAELQKMK